MRRVLGYPDLKPMKGIRYSRQHINRLVNPLSELFASPAMLDRISSALWTNNETASLAVWSSRTPMHDRQHELRLIKGLELTGRRRFAMRAVASCRLGERRPAFLPKSSPRQI